MKRNVVKRTSNVMLFSHHRAY